MYLHRRKHGSQRAMASQRATIVPNVSGETTITLKTEDGIYITLEPETFAEMKRLLSEAHILHHNWPG